jgi:dGTPase
LLELSDLRQVPIFARQLRIVEGQYPQIAGRRLIHEVVRRMINGIVVDLIERSTILLRDANPADIEAVRSCSGPLIQMSDPVWAEHLELKRFLREHLYRHYRVQRMTRKARTVVADLFRAFMEDPMLLPDEYRAAARRLSSDEGESGRARAVADYVAGMTDRYAISEHERIFVPGKRS